MEINVIGYGLMGRQISSLLYLAGCSVHVLAMGDDAEVLFKRQVRLLKRGMENTEDGAINFYKDITELPNVPTIESVIEDLDVKKNIYKQVRERNEKDYYSNTSSYSPKEIAGDVQGLHFFNPITLGLVEVLIENMDSPLIDVLKKLNFEIVSVNDNRGYIGNYILFHEISSALKLVEKYKYSVEQINQVYSKLYAARDIFLIIDIIGLDVVLNILTNLYEDDKTIYMPKMLKVAIDKGVLGRKNKTSIKSIINEL